MAVLHGGGDEWEHALWKKRDLSFYETQMTNKKKAESASC